VVGGADGSMVLLNADVVPAAMDSTVAAVHAKRPDVWHKHEHLMLMEKQKPKCKYSLIYVHNLVCICINRNANLYVKLAVNSVHQLEDYFYRPHRLRLFALD
jgi:hypothetical protein